MTEQNKSKKVTFDNMRALSDINNHNLIRMSKEVEGMQAELERISKHVRSLLHAEPKVEGSAATKVSNEKPEVAPEKPAENVKVIDRKPEQPKNIIYYLLLLT